MSQTNPRDAAVAPLTPFCEKTMKVRIIKALGGDAARRLSRASF
jgi:hypothetical protein